MPESRTLFEVQRLLGIFVDDISLRAQRSAWGNLDRLSLIGWDTDDGDRWDDFQQIRRESLEQASEPFSLDCLPRHVHNTGVRPWM